MLHQQNYLRSVAADARKLNDLTVRVCNVVPTGPWCLAALVLVCVLSAAPFAWIKIVW